MMKNQWFVDCKEMAQSAVRAVDEGQLTLIPRMNAKIWRHWLTNIRDWCISRQLWWGHRIPAYKVISPHTKGEDIWVSAHNEDDARIKAAGQLKVRGQVEVREDEIQLYQDEDVLDTWFSSGLFPFAVHGWPNQTADLAKYYPNTLLETGHDILFFWVARMVMMGHKLTGQLPFHQVYLHSMIRDAHGRKMSKSFGNVIDPLDVIRGISLQGLHDKLDDSTVKLDQKEIKRAKAGQKKDFPKGIPECGTDALRFALCTYKAQGVDINLNIAQVQEYRFFCNKIWNAAKFTFMALGDDFKPSPISQVLPFASMMDRWILSRLTQSCDVINSSMATFDFPVATGTINRFWVKNFCDVYLEYSKPILKSGDPEAVVTCQNVLFTCLEAGLRLISPFMPFISEELFQRLPRRSATGPSITVAPYPTLEEFSYYDSVVESDVEMCLDVVRCIRSMQLEFGIKKAKVFACTSNPKNNKMLNDMSQTINHLSKSGTFALTVTPPSGCLAREVAEECTIYLEASNDLDFDSVLDKLEAKRTKVMQKIDKLESRMSASDYEANVADDIKDQNNKKLKDLQADLEKTICSITTLNDMT